MSIQYHIILYAEDHEADTQAFQVKDGSTEPNLQVLNSFKSLHKTAIKINPYMTVCKMYPDQFAEDFEEFGDYFWCDGDFDDLPEYVQQQIEPLIKFQRSINFTGRKK